MKLIIQIPCYNEAETLDLMLRGHVLPLKNICSMMILYQKIQKQGYDANDERKMGQLVE
jgi:hypothetical protein